MIASILSFIKVILNIAAYTSLAILVSVFIYVRSGHSIMIKYVEEDEEDDENEEY